MVIIDVEPSKSMDCVDTCNAMNDDAEGNQRNGHVVIEPRNERPVNEDISLRTSARAGAGNAPVRYGNNIYDT